MWRRHRLGELERLGRIPGRLGESAELGEALKQPVPIKDRYRRHSSEELVLRVSRQCRQVVGGELDGPLIVAPKKMHLREKGRNQDAECQVPGPPGNV